MNNTRIILTLFPTLFDTLNQSFKKYTTICNLQNDHYIILLPFREKKEEKYQLLHRQNVSAAFKYTFSNASATRCLYVEVDIFLLLYMER